MYYQFSLVQSTVMNKKTTIHILSLILFTTITFIRCSKEDDEINLNPQAGQSFLNIENERYTVTLNAEEPPEGQEGIWRVYSGQHYELGNEKDPKSTFSGMPGEMYRLGWEVSQGKEYKAETITVSFKPLNASITTNVGDTLFNNVSIELEAEAAKFGTIGHWDIISGDGGRIEHADNHIAQFIGKEGTDYELSWRLVYYSPVDSTFKVEDVKSIALHTDTLRADAGEDRRYIRNKVEDEIKYTALEGFLPAGANGQWNLIEGEGGLVYMSQHATSLFEGQAMEDYYLTWTVELDGYTSTDTVNIHFRDKWGLFVDERDGQHYHTVELNGLEWFAENFNYYQAPNEYAWSFYYGQASQAYIRDGYAVETEADRKYYGRLYNYPAAYEWAPEGWRIPTLQEIKDLVEILGGENRAMPKLVDGGETGLDLVFGGLLSYSGNHVENKDFFFDQGKIGYLWTDSFNPDTYGCKLMFFDHYNSVTQEVSALYQTCSVRYVRDIKSEE